VVPPVLPEDDELVLLELEEEDEVELDVEPVEPPEVAPLDVVVVE
jgi:hypothetical protein